MNKKIVLITGLSIVTAGLIYFLVRRNKKKSAASTIAAQTADNTVVGKEAATEFPLKVGSKGDNVKKLQTYLNTKIPLPTKPLVVDGIFGALTEQALKNVTGKTSMDKATFDSLFYKTT